MTRDDDISKALEKLHTSVEGVQGFNVPAGQKWLNHPDSVDPIVRHFAKETIRRFASTGDDMTIDQFTNWMKAEADRLNHLFLTYGLSPDIKYARGVWNTPKQLGFYLRLATRTNGDCAKSVRDAFAALAVNITTVLAEYQDKPIEEWGWQLDALCQELVTQLLGLQEREDDAD